jgi:hypothetical protein
MWSFWIWQTAIILILDEALFFTQFYSTFRIGLLIPLIYSGYYMHHPVQYSVTLHFARRLIVFEICMISRIINDHFFKQHESDDLCNGDVLCFRKDMNTIFVYYLNDIRPSKD